MINGAQLLSVARESNCAIALGNTMMESDTVESHPSVLVTVREML